jgi:uncharacterized protein with ParB-like and HNH nuclease domain
MLYVSTISLKDTVMEDSNRIQVVTCSAAELFLVALSSPDVSESTFLICSEGLEIRGRLNIPEYQRPYCWGAQQLENLLSDIQAHKERTPDLPYYLGSLILQQSSHPSGSGDTRLLNIIDGQQRITTLALFALTTGDHPLQAGSLSFEHPISQNAVIRNITWLKKQNIEELKRIIDLRDLHFSLVVTQSEDDAYRFFETQNTGGVRLAGPDIIKAHHLRAVDKVHLNEYAQRWESLGDLNPSVLAVLRGRYWQQLNWRNLPRHNEKPDIRNAVVNELASQTGDGEDIAYSLVKRTSNPTGAFTTMGAQQGYAMRQPLNAGINTIHYIEYFQRLYQRYWSAPRLAHIEGYRNFIEWLKSQKGCGYLQDLFESCLLLYISQFGEEQLTAAAHKIFRVVYSRRVSNQKAVRENSVPAFVREYPVLDWIAMSYTPEECFARFDAFELVVDPSNLDKESVKRRFIRGVVEMFGLSVSEVDYKTQFADTLSRKIRESA